MTAESSHLFCTLQDIFSGMAITIGGKDPNRLRGFLGDGLVELFLDVFFVPEVGLANRDGGLFHV